MPELARLGAGTINMFANDHPPPHFHVRANDGREMKLQIPTLKVLAGSVDRGLHAKAEAWAKNNMSTLSKKWKALNP